jgi:UDP-2-acetamido-2,6-beta-L-arabino-hexul-4-ose reductase
MTVVVTGAHGFIGQNLRVRLKEGGHDVIALGSASSETDLQTAASKATIVFHLAGVNRPQTDDAFEPGNAGTTRILCDALAKAGNRSPIILASSTQATRDNPYGRSKRGAEDALFAHAQASGAAVRVFRLPNVFGKWARPNYNSAVATFCHNVARGLPITVNDPTAALSLVHVDDVCDAFLALMAEPIEGASFAEVAPVHATTVGAVADAIRGFAESRATLVTDRVGTGLTRAIYATYVSYLEPDAFAYTVPRHADPRGVFVEMLKTPDSGQFSYFTAGPGVTRGQHYHHAKTEKFLVLRGRARFGFRHIVTGHRHEIVTEGGEATIVETIPGWTHDITNIGDDEMIVMLWANEIFDRARPDTIAEPV